MKNSDIDNDRHFTAIISRVFRFSNKRYLEYLEFASKMIALLLLLMLCLWWYGGGGRMMTIMMLMMI
jgi:hypothetical protein